MSVCPPGCRPRGRDLTRTVASTRYRVWGWLVVAAALVVLAIVTANPGSSPLRATGSTPGDGARLEVAPAEVEVSFDGVRDPILFHLVVTPDDDGRRILSQATAQLDGDRLVVPIDVERPGRFVATYHVALADGQQTTGFIRFTVLSPGDQTATATGSPPLGIDAAAAGHGHGDADPMSRVLLVMDLLLVVGLIVVLVRGPRLRRGGDQPDAPVAAERHS